jgi:DNA binding domain, excisionase family
MNNDAPRLLTTEQAAAALSVGSVTIRRWWKAGKLAGIKIGPNSLRFAESEIKRFIEERTKAA